MFVFGRKSVPNSRTSLFFAFRTSVKEGIHTILHVFFAPGLSASVAPMFPMLSSESPLPPPHRRLLPACTILFPRCSIICPLSAPSVFAVRDKAAPSSRDECPYPTLFANTPARDQKDAKSSRSPHRVFTFCTPIVLIPRTKSSACSHHTARIALNSNSFRFGINIIKTKRDKRCSIKDVSFIIIEFLY